MANPTEFSRTKRFLVVIDNLGKTFLIDTHTKSRYPVTGTGQLAVLERLYGKAQNRDPNDGGNIHLTGWSQGPSAVELFGGPQGLEQYEAGGVAHPIDGTIISTTQPSTGGAGNVEYHPGQGQQVGPDDPTYTAPPGATFDPTPPMSRPSNPNSPESKEERQEQLSIEERSKIAAESLAQIMEVLRPYGFSEDDLATLSTLIQTAIAEDKGVAQIMQDIRASEPYAKRFPGMQARQDGGLSSISEAEYISLERSYRNTLRAAGLPVGFYDAADDFTSFIGGDISPAELEERVIDGYVEMQNSPQEVRDALREMYGLGDQDLLAYFLDPERATSILEKQVKVAQIGGAATRSGFGSISTGQGEELAGLDVSEREAQAGFRDLTLQKQLFGSLPGERGVDISKQQQLDARFGGDAKQLERIRQQQERRVARFSGTDAGASVGQSGASGLKSASS